jgi:hypothetical protein
MTAEMETRHGAAPRFWEDVEVGDELEIVTNGPLRLTGEIDNTPNGPTVNRYADAGLMRVERIASGKLRPWQVRLGRDD